MGQHAGYQFTKYSKKDGLEDNYIRSMLIDDNGCFWIGTWNGLSKFDGYDFEAIKYESWESELTQTKIIQQLFFDKFDNIWIGNETAQFGKYDQSLDYIKADSTLNIYRIIEAKGYNQLFFQTFDRKFKYQVKEDQFETLNINLFVDGRNISRTGLFYIDRDNTLLYKINDTLYHGQMPEIFSPNISINLSAFDTGNYNVLQDKFNLVVINNQTSTCFQIKNGELDTLLHQEEMLWLDSSDKIFKILKDESRIWIYTHKRKLYIYDKNKKQYDLIPSHLWQSDIMTLQRDDNGVIWIGSVDGLIRAEFLIFKQYKSGQNVKEIIFSVYKDSKGRVWTGGESGKVFQFNNGKVKQFQHEADEVESSHRFHSRVFDITEDGTKRVWVTIKGSDNLLYIDESKNKFKEYIPQHLKIAKRPDQLVNLYRKLYCSDEGDIWIGGRYSMYKLDRKENKLEELFQNNGKTVGEGSVWDLDQDNQGRLWFGGFGLQMYDPFSKEYANFSPNFTNKRNTSNYVFSIYNDDPRNEIWVGTLGGGLFKFNKSTFEFEESYSVKDGLGDNLIYAIYGDGKDNLWIANMKSISYFDRSTNSFLNFKYPENFEINEVNSEAHYHDPFSDEIIIGGMKGAIGFYPDQLLSSAQNTKLQPVHVSTFKANSKPIGINFSGETKDTINLEKGTDFLELEFLCINTKGYNINYRYQLKGIDKDWVYPKSERRFVSYNNIVPEKYDFIVQASVYNQNWEDNTYNLHINVSGYFWQRLWFRLLAVILFSAVIAYIIFLKFRNYRLIQHSQTKELERKEALLQSLSAQMNPHFLFNALNSINNFIATKDKRKANEYLGAFANLMRQILENSKKEKISLAKELECLHLYLNLEHLRASGSFDYNIDVDPNIDTSTVFVPPMIVQPFVENAIWHGMVNNEKQGQLDINFERSSNMLRCKIVDNGIGYTVSQNNKQKTGYASTGIENVRRRMNILSSIEDRNHDFEIKEIVDSDGVVCGTAVEIVLASLEESKT